MGSEKVGTMVPPHQIHNNPHPQLVFSEPFPCGGPTPPNRRSSDGAEPGPKAASTRKLTSSFLDHHHFFPPPQTAPFLHQQWNSDTRSGDGSEDDDVEEDDDDMEDDEVRVDEESNMENNAVTVAKNSGGNNQTESCSANSRNQKMKAFGNVVQSISACNSGDNRCGEVGNARGGEMYYAQYLNGAEGPSSSSGQKDNVMVENGCGFSGRKEGSYLYEAGESLRAIFSDPLTGTLMDDALILPCGHSFGSGGIQQVIRMKACCTCSQPVMEDSIYPNLSLRLAVQAFIREEELQVNRASKRRRERYDRDKGTYGDSTLTENPRGRGVQFPFAVTDRVVIKGNKRTPLRFVGREAIVTNQCLNGWYVVKTLDNAESVKLQYRSLAKVAENPSSKESPMKMTPNWL